MNAPRPSIAQLNDPGLFELIADIAHSEVIVFVRHHLHRLSWITCLYWLLNAFAFAIIICRWRRSGLPAAGAFPTACLGMVVAYLLLLPVHEHAHAFAYRLLGARETRVRYQLRRLTALCEAPGTVFSGREFVLVCLAPLVIINPVLTALACLVGQDKIGLLISGALLLHTGACSGDIALVNFVWQHRGRAQFTYDDAQQQRGRFFRSIV